MSRGSTTSSGASKSSCSSYGSQKGLMDVKVEKGTVEEGGYEGPSSDCLRVLRQGRLKDTAGIAFVLLLFGAQYAIESTFGHQIVNDPRVSLVLLRPAMKTDDVSSPFSCTSRPLRFLIYSHLSPPSSSSSSISAALYHLPTKTSFPVRAGAAISTRGRAGGYLRMQLRARIRRCGTGERRGRRRRRRWTRPSCTRRGCYRSWRICGID
jgi:hypothetical protein